MDQIIINGGTPLSGSIEVSGMKNGALPILFATILVEEKCIIENLPNISDVTYTLEMLHHMGADVKMLDKSSVEINTKNIRWGSAPFDLARNMRASYYILGAELGRFKKSKVACPGGCDFGVRPIDQHIKGFEALGANVTLSDGCVHCSLPEGENLKGTNIYMDIESVGATINIILAAVKADGKTIIDNAAREPHIVDLANFLNTCGADIAGAGTSVIKIRGVAKLHGATYGIIPDMIEAGTYMIAAAATNSLLTITNVIPKHLESISAKLEEMGVTITEQDESVIVDGRCKKNRIKVKTLPYPGFPTDMNPQMCVLLCLADGTSTLTEGVWDNRFRYVDQLYSMGAIIKVEQKTAIIEGVKALKPAVVKAVDLRAGAAMVIAGLAAPGKTIIEDIHHIERGYERMVEKLCACGADISKAKSEEHKAAMSS
ncbi:UDP-N-acetylglucosamine 1-carboxyvinyltransferase [Eubacteriales bacterium OttesenSCG-928-G02]|nr:UDP-N-acetylglucosamine 1-carboxyvinyltransferase [Eubacteriales bacterium OttesenSCG-928-G02]